MSETAIIKDEKCGRVKQERGEQQCIQHIWNIFYSWLVLPKYSYYLFHDQNYPTFLFSFSFFLISFFFFEGGSIWCWRSYSSTMHEIVHIKPSVSDILWCAGLLSLSRLLYLRVHVITPVPIGYSSKTKIHDFAFQFSGHTCLNEFDAHAFSDMSARMSRIRTFLY